MSITHRLAHNLRRIRDERSLSQAALAELSGVSRSTIAALEGERYASIDTLTLERLASALRLQVASLIDSKSPKSA